MLERVKLALRITEPDFDEEIKDLIAAAKRDLRIAGVDRVDESDPLIIRAVCTYCKMSFGEPDQYDRLKAAYDEQKAQLGMCSNYSNYEV